jgi:hypothetical protein
VKLTTDHRLVSKLRMLELHLHFTFLYGVVLNYIIEFRDDFTFDFLASFSYFEKIKVGS